MLTLAFDTTSSTLSVALLNNEEIVTKNTIFEKGRQSELLIPEVERTLKKNKIWYQNLDLIAATNGPGSFTGSRVGLTCARTLKTATNLPLILVNTCEVIAFKYRHISGKVFALLDASMGEFFIGEFFIKNNEITQITEPKLIKPEELQTIFLQKNFFLCGSGKKLMKLACHMSQEDDTLEADLIGLLAYNKFKNGEISKSLNPLYLRNPKISKRKK